MCYHLFMLREKISSKGFTLLEILLVVGIIAILAGIVIVAINPGRQLGTVRNTERKSDLKQISNAVQQYYIDENTYPDSISTTLTEICDTGTGTTTHSVDCDGLIDLSTLISTYFVAVPKDPQATTTNGTGYYIMKNSANKIILSAPEAELDQTISIGSVPAAASFVCGSTLTDTRDSETYTTVLIDTQCWMQENLNIGTMVTGVTTQTNNATIEKYCYNNSESNCTTYGGLYQWNEAMAYSASCNGTGESQPACSTPAQGICPTGWHMPSHYEWTALEREVCTSDTCLTDFPYNTTTTGWKGTDEGSHLSNLTLNHDNTSGFSALLPGYRRVDESFLGLGVYELFWSSLERDSSAWLRNLFSGYSTVFREAGAGSLGLSVRCLKD